MSCWYCVGILLVLLLLRWVGAGRVPSWGLPARGHVHGLVADFAGVQEVLPGKVVVAAVLSGRRILGGVKRVRLHRKTPAHLAGYGRDGVFSLGQGSGRD